MAYMAFTKKFDDNSTEQGFEFVFYCDISGEPVRTKFIESKAGSKAEKTRVIGKGISFGGGFLKSFGVGIPGVSQSDIGKDADNAGGLAEELSKKFGKMSSQWHKEHDEAFEFSQNDAKRGFNQCSICNRWACSHCWDGQKKLCIEDAKKALICSKCHQPAGTGKFCNNCGAPLTLKCSKCGTAYTEGKKFCGECGTALG